jgi:hypothetical protein
VNQPDAYYPSHHPSGPSPHYAINSHRISSLRLSMLIQDHSNSSRHHHRHTRCIPVLSHRTRVPGPPLNRTIICPPIPNTPPRAAHPLLCHVLSTTHPPPPTRHLLEIVFLVSSVTGRLLARTTEEGTMKLYMPPPPSYTDVVTVGRTSVARTHLNATSIMDATRCLTNRSGK